MAAEPPTIMMTPRLEAALRAARRREADRARTLAWVALVIAVILTAMLVAGLTLTGETARDLRMVATLMGVWMAFLMGLCFAIFGWRRWQFSRELHSQRVIAKRVRLRSWWLIRDTESDELPREQYMRAKGVRGVLLVPVEFHQSWGKPREADAIYTPYSKVLLEVDGEPVWPTHPADSPAIDR